MRSQRGFFRSIRVSRVAGIVGLLTLSLPFTSQAQLQPCGSSPPCGLQGPWQLSTLCPDAAAGNSGDIFITDSRLITHDPNSGAGTLRPGEHCGSAFFGPVLQWGCEPNDPPPDPNAFAHLFQLTDANYREPPAGFRTDTSIFDPPIPNQQGCDLLRSVEVESVRLGTAFHEGDGVALRVEGTIEIGLITSFDPNGVQCGPPSSGGGLVCTFIMLRSDVPESSALPPLIIRGIPVTPVTTAPFPRASITFTQVDAEGTAAIVNLSVAEATLDPNLEIIDDGGIPIYFGLRSTATNSGEVTTCVPYPDSNNDGVVDGTSTLESELLLLINEGGAFVDRTVSLDPNGNEICATSSAFREAVVATRVSGAPIEPNSPAPGPGAQSKDQQKCIVEANKKVAKVVKALNKDMTNCIKNGGKNKNDKLGSGCGTSIDCCTTADAKSKVSKAKGKLKTKVAAKCVEAPDFGTNTGGLPDPNGLNDLGDTALELAEALFGSSLDAAIVRLDKDADKASEAVHTKLDGKCQTQIIKSAGKCLDTKWKIYNKCKKNALKGKTTPAPITDAAGLEACVASTPTDSKVIKTCSQKLDAKMTKKCSSPVVLSEVIPNAEAAAVGDLQLFIDARVECLFCRMVNEADGLNVDCDLFDDGLANGSCP